MRSGTQGTYRVLRDWHLWDLVAILDNRSGDAVVAPSNTLFGLVEVRRRTNRASTRENRTSSSAETSCWRRIAVSEPAAALPSAPAVVVYCMESVRKRIQRPSQLGYAYECLDE